MALPFFRIKPDVQDEHALYGDDVQRMDLIDHVSRNDQDLQYAEVLEKHKKKCPICSWPRLYPWIRKFVQWRNRVLRRKVF